MTLEDIRQYCLSRGLTDGTMTRIVNDYKITSLLKKATKLHLDRPLDFSDKKKEYPPELKTNVREANTLEEMMKTYRDSIAYRMMESIRKDCGEE